MLKIDKLSKSFNPDTKNEINIFNGLSLEIKANKSTTIIGANGCGKSTLLNIIAASVPMDSGRIILNNQDISHMKEEERALSISRVYQDPSMGVAPSLTIAENLSLADKKGEKFGLARLVKKKNISYYRDLLKDLNLGLEDKLNTEVRYLSGGQRQALSLLMATIKKPKLLLLDEHTAALDPKTSKLIMEKTRDLINREKITTLMISHNMKDAINYSDYILMLDKGDVVFYKKTSEVEENDLLALYDLS